MKTLKEVGLFFVLIFSIINVACGMAGFITAMNDQPAESHIVDRNIRYFLPGYAIGRWLGSESTAPAKRPLPKVKAPKVKPILPPLIFVPTAGSK